MERLDRGGLIDRSRPIQFTVDGQACTGYAGDTIASALLAGGHNRVGDSIYRSRPRGVFSAGVEEPNAFVQIRGVHDESMVPATTVAIRPGMDVRLLSGLGALDQRPDPCEYDTMNLHVDVAVVGTGPAGLAAAGEAAATGARVAVFEQDAHLGGSLLADPAQAVTDRTAADWADSHRSALNAGAQVTVLTHTTVIGSYDSNYLLAVERRGEQFSGETRPGISRQRVWQVYANQVVLATGAIERPVVFADNDVPGLMLASAVHTYLGRYAVLPGRQAVVFTTNDSAYPVALALNAAGATVTVIDARSAPSVACDQAVAAGLLVRSGRAVVGIEGTTAVAGAWIARIDDTGTPVDDAELLGAELVAVSGGWSPTVHLHSQRQGTLVWDDHLSGFVPDAPVAAQHLAGAVTGTYWTDGCVAEGRRAGRTAAAAAGFAPAEATNGTSPPAGFSPDDGDDPSAVTIAKRREQAGVTRQLWFVASPGGTYDSHMVDLHRDQSVADVRRATGAGMRSVEHVKRYTSIGTGVEQGKSSGVTTIGLLTELLVGDTSGPDTDALTPGDIGTTTFRAPYTPVAFAALAGRRRGDLFDPVRTTPMHQWHVARGAAFEDVGQWKRPRFFPQPGEDMDTAVARECRAAREGVAFQDVTTLGKIEIRGADAPQFLNRIYTNGFAKLTVGKGRYGMMCTPDGMVFDDGVSLRLADDRYLMTATTGNAAAVLDWLEQWAQTEWPELDVWFTSVTEQWATAAVVGPQSRAVVAAIAPDLDVTAEGFDFMAFRETTLASGVPARICRISFSGELAFEVNVATWYGLKVWEDIAAAGAASNITPYGTETMHVLRAEKAFPIVGQDTDGTVTPHDLGMDWVISKHKDFIGNRSYATQSHRRSGRKQLVSVLPADPLLRLPEGAQLIETSAADDHPGNGRPAQPVPMLGHITSSYHSQALGHSFGLAMVTDGRQRIGDTLLASFQGRVAPVRVGEPVLYDKEGARRDG